MILAVLALGLTAARLVEPGAVADWFAWIGVVLDFVATALVFSSSPSLCTQHSSC